MNTFIEDVPARRQEWYSVSPNRKATNALVRLEVGTGSDPAAGAQALKHLKRKLAESGTASLVTRRGSRLYCAMSPAQREREKRRRARTRAHRAAVRGR